MFKASIYLENSGNFLCLSPGNDSLYARIIFVGKRKLMDFRSGYFIGKYTFEVDMMECTSTEDGERAFTDTFNQLVESNRKQNNFKNRLRNQDYEFCLRRIEDQSVGKGRFAQIFSGKCVSDNCPDYVKNAIEYIYTKVDE